MYELRLEQEALRHGYATAFLAYLACQYDQPITPVHIIFSGRSFWEKAAWRGPRYGWTITAEVSSSELDEEAERWAHLAPEAAKLEQEISRRLAAREPYEMAVGRGLSPAS